MKHSDPKKLADPSGVKFNKKLGAFVTEPYTDLRQMWGTPDDFFAAANNIFGPFTIDVCAMPFNTKCKKFILPEKDSLTQRWVKSAQDRPWCNPGFHDIGPWCEKAFEETARVRGSMAAVVTIPSTASKWWAENNKKAWEIADVCGKRIQFVPYPCIKKSSNAYENCLIIFRGPRPVGRPLFRWDWFWEQDV